MTDPERQPLCQGRCCQSACSWTSCFLPALLGVFSGEVAVGQGILILSWFHGAKKGQVSGFSSPYLLQESSILHFPLKHPPRGWD